MKLDTVTLMMVGSITAGLAGLVLLGVWIQLRHATALLWWFAADILYAAGVALLAANLPDGNMPLVVAGLMISGAAAPLIWIGTITFRLRRTPVVPVLIAAGAWLATNFIETTLLNSPLVGFAAWVVWLSLSAFELWRGRAERIPARWPLAGLFLVHASVFAGGIYDVHAGRISENALAPLNSWFGAIFIEGVVYAMASAILMTLICKERETQRYRRAAHTDSLTGIANHGTLMDGARRLFQRCRKGGTPFSLIMFDLDHFKAVNDRYGHRTGDEILCTFTDTVRGLLRPNDLFGRYGGEEFTVVLPGATVETAYVIAERVRYAFAESHHFLDGQPLNATVSAGVAEAGAGMTFEDTFDAADRATYQAKTLGRNRVERTERPRPAEGEDAVIRIA